MQSGPYRFDRFELDPADRRLTRDGVPVELNARYFDALVLLVREHGQLVTKDRFMAEVWRGIPVTDEALTQCIANLRRQLGDSATGPRFIETVPKHGYRFVAPLETRPVVRSAFSSRDYLTLSLAGTIGAGFAGAVGGVLYGSVAATQPGVGAVSVLLVVVAVSIVMAVLGGAGVSAGVAAAGFVRRGGWRWSIVGGAVGGFVVGAVVKLLGLDAFQLLLGRSPGDFTGATEGLLLGAAVGCGAWTAGARGIGTAAAAGAGAGLLISLAGGRLLGGSLDALARSFPDSRLRLDPIGTIFGESGFGPVSHAVTAALEGALFAACVVGALVVVRALNSPA